MNDWTQAVALAKREHGDSIEAHHAAFEYHGRRTLVHAYCIGKALAEKKAKIGHGGWGIYCEGLPFERWQASRYMQFAELADARPEKCCEVATFGVERAIKALKPPPEPREHDEPDTAVVELKSLPAHVDNELANVHIEELERFVSLLRNDELWINPAAARKTLAREIIKLAQSLA